MLARKSAALVPADNTVARQRTTLAAASRKLLLARAVTVRRASAFHMDLGPSGAEKVSPVGGCSAGPTARTQYDERMSPRGSTADARPTPDTRALFLAFFKVGVSGFGG